ncbi:MAG: MFS transporter [Candidatus Promineifilaceae bacterium]|nr:MFS transporter [Candidatus Promineifilaceae bacterium]
MRHVLGNKQLLILFLASFFILFVGMGLFPLLPLYAAGFGARPAAIGLYFAIVFTANAAGPLFAGWLSKRFSLKSLFFALAAAPVPAVALLGQATAFWQLVVLTSFIWFTGGAVLALVGVLTAVHAGDEERGAAYSLMFTAYPLAGVVGGATAGWLVEASGYPALFLVMAAVWIGTPLSALVVRDHKDGEVVDEEGDEAPVPVSAFGRSYFGLLVAALLVATAVNVSRLGTSLSMEALSFSPGAVASTATVSGLITMPLTLLIGALSDRLGRQRFMTAGYLLAAAAAVALVVAQTLWQFWLAATLAMIAYSVTNAVGSALAADLLPKRALGRGIAWFNAVNSAAGIVSFAAAGMVMEALGPVVLYVGTAGIALLATVQLGALACDPGLPWRFLWQRMPATRPAPACV